MVFNVSKRLYTLLLLMGYLFVVVTHIFFIPNRTHNFIKVRSCYNSVFKRKIEDGKANGLALLHRTDKAVFNFKKIAARLFLAFTSVFLIHCFNRFNFLRRSMVRRYNDLYLPPYQLFISSLRI